MTTERKYPIGIQTFSEIIRGGYLYVDKTDLVWQLAHYAKYIFLSRPRRFGKSLLSSTLHGYFAALQQIDESGYAKPFATDGRKIVKVGIKFSPETMTVENWAIEA